MAARQTMKLKLYAQVLDANHRNLAQEPVLQSPPRNAKITMKNNRLRLARLPVVGAVCAAVFLFVSADSALAQEWRFEPILKIGGEYDDNATLDPRTDQEVSVSGLLFDARANVRYSSPNTSFLIQPRVTSRNYDDESEFDSDDYFLRSNLRHRFELGTVGFRMNYEDQSVRTGERSDSDLEIEDPDEIVNDDTGRVFRFGSRQKWRVSPYWQYRLSNVSSINASIGYPDTRYDDVFAGLLTDFTDTRINLGYQRSLSNLTSGLITLTGRRFDSEGSTEEIDGYGISGGIQHALSEKTRVRAIIGIEDTDQPGFETDPEMVGSVTLTRNLETIRLLAQYRRSVSGSGAGGVSTRDSLILNFRRRLSERVAAGLGVRAYRSNDNNDAILDQDQDYIQLRSNFIWYLSRSLVVEADYRYTVIDRGGDLGERANSNQVNLWFVYQPRTTPEL